jgi:Na+/proline symporter
MDAGRLATLLMLVAYVGMQIGIGIWVSRRIQSRQDYFTGGRSLGLIPVTLSLFATWFGAETIMGSSAAIAEGGLSGARAEPFGYAICLAAMGLFIAVPFRRAGYVTLADFFAARFGKTSELVVALIMIPISVVWAAAQLLALAAILEAVLGLPAALTLAAAAITVIVYTTFGGFVGDVYTDMIQSVVLIIGVGVIFFAAAGHFGGGAGLAAAIRPEQLELLAPGESWLGQIDSWAIPILGSLIAQEALARLVAARDEATARRATFLAASIYLLVGMAPVLIGLAGPHFTFDAAEGDAFLPSVATTLLAPALFIVFAGALLSAILSTVDSNVIAVSSFVTQNVLAARASAQSAKAQLLFARGVTIAAGVAAWATASSGSSIYDLIQLTSVFGQGGILVATLIGLGGRFGGQAAALGALAASVAVNLVTLAIMPLAAMRSAGAGWGEAFAALLAGDAPVMEGYFLASIAAAILAYGVFAAAGAGRTAERGA